MQHPKFEGWTKTQKWDWLELMGYCARYQTAGRIPNDKRLLPRSCTKQLLDHARISGLIDSAPDGSLWIHDWTTYNPSDPTKTSRQAKWRANKRLHVDDSERLHVDGEVDDSERLQNVYLARVPPVPSPTTEGSNVCENRFSTNVVETSRARAADGELEATMLALEAEHEAARFVQRSDDGEPFKFAEMQKLGEWT
jgi:hypothetical protein